MTTRTHTPAVRGLAGRAVAAGATFGLLGPLAGTAVAAPNEGTHVSATDTASCEVPANADPEVLTIIERELDERDASAKVRLSAYEAAWVESHANNLNCGDSDSLGVFQQRPSAGWGTPEQVTNVEYATNAYLDQAIPNDANNPGYTAGQLAQSVQRSAYPDRYDEAEAKAKELQAQAQG